MGQIGRPLKEIYVEPLTVPVPSKAQPVEPVTAPSPQTDREKPVMVPA